MNQECRLVFPVRKDGIDISSIENNLSISGNVAVTSTEVYMDVQEYHKCVYFVVTFVVTTSNISMAIAEVANICERATR